MFVDSRLKNCMCGVLLIHQILLVVHTCCCVVLRLQEGEPQGRHVVIVDDLVQSGGTLIECHALLSSLGAKHGKHGQHATCTGL
jgi:hypothetical protein